jgi:hypothetical protein
MSQCIPVDFYTENNIIARLCFREKLGSGLLVAHFALPEGRAPPKGVVIQTDENECYIIDNKLMTKHQVCGWCLIAECVCVVWCCLIAAVGF